MALVHSNAASGCCSSETVETVIPGTRYSIVITCRNQEQFIQAAVDSVLSQNDESMEVIVVDDGSSDASSEILNRYGSQVKLISIPVSKGAIAARNRGAAAAKGDYLIFLDGDDLLTPWALDVHDQIITEQRPGTIVSGARWFSGPVPELGPADIPKNVEFAEYGSLMERDRPSGWYTGGFVVRRHDFLEVGGWTPEIFHLDLLELATKLRDSGKSVLVCSPYTMLYRMHGANSIRNVPACVEAAHQLIERERAGHYPGSRRTRIERLSWYAGIIICLAKRGLRFGLYKDSLCLVVSGWSMILAAIVRGTFCRIRGRRPIHTRALQRKRLTVIA